MVAMHKGFIALFSLLPLLVSAVINDWSKPCSEGVCSYDVPASANSMVGGVVISGSRQSISDITKVAGWEILDCAPDADAQDIRIVCTDDKTKCSHLFENGAEHTIVRLPEECGSAPFARVTRCTEAEDQELPAELKSRLGRRDGADPTVHMLSFDTKFQEVPASQHGDVSMVVYGSTIPELIDDAELTPPGPTRRSHYMSKRGLLDKVLGGISNLNSTQKPEFSNTTWMNLPRIQIDKYFNIYNTSLSCSANEKARPSVDVHTKLDAQIGIVTVIAGQMIPLNITEFGLFATMSADLVGGLKIRGNVSGQIDTGKIPLFSVGLSTLSIPGILSFGPSFEIDAQALASIDVHLGLDVDIGYNFSELQLVFPPSDKRSSKAVVAPKDTPLKISISPNAASNASFQAHLIPTLKFGLDVLGSGADIFLDVDTFAELDLNLRPSVDSSGTTNTSSHVRGCLDLYGGLSINAGAEASFFGLFDASTEVNLFSEKYDFFQKCFDESNAVAKNNARSLDPFGNTIKKRDLRCLAPEIAAAASIIDQVIASSSFKSKPRL